MTFRLTSLMSLLASLMFLVSSLAAQTGTGRVTGHIFDAQGAMIANAQVVAVNTATGVRTIATTNSSGIYDIENLIPGTYIVEASATNFKKVVQPNVLIQVESNIGLDLRLEVGTMAETVTVTTVAPQLRTEDAQQGEVINNQMIETLPQLNRDPLQLLTLSGEVEGSGDRAGWNFGANASITSGPTDTRINGGRAAGIEYLIDGVPATGGFVHSVVNATPAMDDVAEFKVITNGLSSEYGRLSGGVVEVTTKSGTNAIHGQLFEYHQDAALNANSWGNDHLCPLDPVTDPLRGNICDKANFRQNDFGFALGGPVVIPHVYDGHNKTFWYGNAEWVRQSTSGNAGLGQTVTDLERNSIPNPFSNNQIATPTPCPAGAVAYIPNPSGNCADLTDIGVAQGDPNYPFAQIYDPFAGTVPEPLAGGDGRHVPISELDPVILHYVALLPHANFTPHYGNTGGNYAFRQPGNSQSLNWSTRLDHVINDKQRIFARFDHNTYNSYQQGEYGPQWAGNVVHLDGGFSASLNYDYAISPTLILDLRTGGNYSPAVFGSYMPTSFAGTADWGFPASITNIIGTSFPMNIKNGPRTEGTGNGLAADATITPATTQGNTVNVTNFMYSAALTKVLNRHTLKFGYEGRRYYDNINQTPGANPVNPGDGYSFMGAGVNQFVTNDQWDNQGRADGVGAFLMGLDSWSQVTASVSKALESNYYASFAQDDFKVSRKLTLNLGLRWEVQTGVTERHNDLTVWNPNAPSPFTVNAGYNFQSAVASGIAAWNSANTGYAPLNASQVAVPAWASSGKFAPGAIEFVGSPEHPGRAATDLHPWNFSPRVGFAYQVLHNTVIRGSFGVFYLPTGGNLTQFSDSPGVIYSAQANNTNTQVSGYTPGPGLQTASNPFAPSQIFQFTHESEIANVQAADHGSGTGSVLVTSHMPHENDWSFGIQHQLPHNWLLEATYSGNYSNSLYAPYYPSEFPRGLFTPANMLYYLGDPGNSLGGGGADAPLINSPTAGQISNGNQANGANLYTGNQQRLGMLEYPYPYYGPVVEQDANIGTAHYESGNFRIEKRFSSGFQMLLNYTLSKALDDVGSANQASDPQAGGGTGSNGKSFQSINQISSVYGLAAADETHRVSVFYNYQLPFGRGRQWMNSPTSFAGHVFEAVAGGWEFSGQTLWNSGVPITFTDNNTQPNSSNNIDIVQTNGSIAPGHSVQDLVVPGVSPYVCSTGCPGTKVKFSNASGAYVVASPFQYGDVPISIGSIRQPGNWTTNISLMKSFPVMSSDGSRYFQLRFEGQNIFNHPGYGTYDTDVQDGAFGLITGVANQERHVQVSGRFVF